MSSLFKRVTLPLLTVAATAALCGSTLAATATWSECKVSDTTNFPHVIAQRVDCNVDAYNQWISAEFHVQLVGGNESYKTTDSIQNVYGYQVSGPGDFLDPQGNGYHPVKVVGGGTYNNWCICSGGHTGGSFSVSTGGTTYLNIPS